MPRDRSSSETYVRPVRRILVGVLIFLLMMIFVIWRIDNPRVERLRAAVTDKLVPSFEWASVPITKLAGMVQNYESYSRIYEQSQELRRELQQMKAWKEAALQLEQENARLLDLNKVKLDPKFTFVTGLVLADSGSPFRQSVLLNIGARDGILDGWAAMDGLGLVGRISGVGEKTSRVLLLSDTNSKVPVTIQPSGQRAVLSGDNTALPLLEFIEKPELVRPGDSVVTSGDGGVFPAGLVVGQVVKDQDDRLRIRMSADYERLEFLRVLRTSANDPITDPGSLIVAPALPALADTVEGQ